MRPVILGLDPSLTCTGLAGDGWVTTIQPGRKVEGTFEQRARMLIWITREVLGRIYEAKPDMVVIEGPALFAKFGMVHERAGLWWRLVVALMDAGIKVAVVPPKSLKTYITGKGNAQKKDVIEAVNQHFGDDFEPRNDNEADAMVLCAMGYDHAGYALVDVGEKQRKALKGVEW